MKSLAACSGWRLAGAGAVVALVFAGCGAGGDPLEEDSGGGNGGNGGNGEQGASDGDSAALRIGSADFPESTLLAEIYAEALRAEGVEVDTQLSIGSRERYLTALEGGSIDLIPEYTGNLLEFYDDQTEASEPAEVYAELSGVLGDELRVLEMSAAQNSDAVVVTSQTAQELDLSSIGDLEPHAQDMVLGGPAEWRDRQTGLPGLEEVYGLTFGEFRPADSTQNASFLDSGQVDAANIFTTDPAIVENDFVVLDDPENLFAAQNVVPLIRQTEVSDPVRTALNEVSADLDTETLTELGARVISDNEDPAAVAAEWVDSR